MPTNVIYVESEKSIFSPHFVFIVEYYTYCVHCGLLNSCCVQCGVLNSFRVHCGVLNSFCVHCGVLNSFCVHCGIVNSFFLLVFQQMMRCEVPQWTLRAYDIYFKHVHT